MKQLRETLSYSTVALVFLLWALFSSFADSPRSPLTEYHQRVWTVEHGLPDNSIRSILQARDGYLWVGTYVGLARFDGLKFVIFNHENSPLPEHDVRMVLAEDTDASLWIGTEMGVFHYKEGHFTHFTTHEGLWHDEVFVLHIGKSGKLWIGTQGGLNQFDNGTIKRLPTVDWTAVPDQMVWDLCEDESGVLWIVSSTTVHKREIKSWKLEIVIDHSDNSGPIHIRV